MPDCCCCSRGGIPCPNLLQGLAECTELPWGALLNALDCPAGTGALHGVRAPREFPSGWSPHHFLTSTGHRPSGIMDMGRRRGERGNATLAPAVQQWISGKKIQQIPTWNSLAPRAFPYPSGNPSCEAPSVSKFTSPMSPKFLSPRTGFAIDLWMALHSAGTSTVGLEFPVL